MIPLDELTEFYIENTYPKEYETDIFRLTQTKGFYVSLPPMEGAIEALKDIEDNCLDFIDPYICTAPETRYEDLMCHSEKVQWLRQHVGDFWVKRTIITKDKTLVRANGLFDDKPLITGAMDPTWDHIIYAHKYNEKCSHGLRLTWKDWPILKETIIKHVKEQRAEDEFWLRVQKGDLGEHVYE